MNYAVCCGWCVHVQLDVEGVERGRQKERRKTGKGRLLGRWADRQIGRHHRRHKTYLADSTLPKKTSSTSSGLICGTRSTAALIAWDPSWVALRLERDPRNDPTGVLAADTM